MDVVIAIDVSGSIRENRFPIVIKYIQSVVNNFDVADDRVRVGVLAFSDTPVVKFHLSAYKRKEDILQAIDVIQYTRGKTNMADALVLARSMFTRANGDRDDAPNILWIFTDGVPTLNQDRTIPESILTKNAGIYIQSTIMTPDPPTLDMKNLVNDPWDRNLFTTRSYNDLASFLPSRLLCEDINECDSSPCRNGGQCVNGMGRFHCVCTGSYSGNACTIDCGQSVDIVFILDASGSVEKAFEVAQRLVRLIIQNLNFADGRTRVGVVLYGDEPRRAFNLNRQPADKQSIQDAIAFSLLGGRTNTAGALDMARDGMFTAASGDRNGVRNIAVVVTDRLSNINQPNTVPAAVRLRQA